MPLSFTNMVNHSILYYRQTSHISRTPNAYSNIHRFAIVFAESIEAMCKVENKDVVDICLNLQHHPVGWWVSTYRQTFNISCTKSPNLNSSPLVLQLFLLNPSKPGVKRLQAMLQLHLSGQQFWCLLRCILYERFHGLFFNVSLALYFPDTLYIHFAWKNTENN